MIKRTAVITAKQLIYRSCYAFVLTMFFCQSRLSGQITIVHHLYNTNFCSWDRIVCVTDSIQRSLNILNLQQPTSVIFVNGNGNENIRYRKNNESVNANGNVNICTNKNETETKKYKTKKKRKREITKQNRKVSKPLRSLVCRGCTATISCATEALKHVAKCLSVVPCSYVPTQLSVGLRNVCHICHGPPVTCTAMGYWLCHKGQYPSFKFASSGTRPRVGSCISDVQ